MGKRPDEKPGRLAELLTARFERILGKDVEVMSPERILGRDSGRVREVDVTLRRRVGTADVLIAIECRDRKAPADVRWINELVMKGRDVGASRVVAVSSSGFSKAARRSADVHGILLRELTEISANEIDRWFVRTQISVPRWQYLGAIVVTKDPEHTEIVVSPNDPGPVFLIPPVQEARALSLFWEPVLQQILESPEGVAEIPRDGSKRLLYIIQSPESSEAAVVTADGTYPLKEIQAGVVLWMEPLTYAAAEARQYSDDEGVLAEMSSYVYPMPDGYWTVSMTVTHQDGEYLSKHAKEQEPPPVDCD